MPLTVCAQTLYPGHIWGFVAVIKIFFFYSSFVGVILLFLLTVDCQNKDRTDENRSRPGFISL